MGGRDRDNVRLNDVWYSTDGVRWTTAAAEAPWPPRSGPASVVFNERIWVIGGHGSDGYLNDVWSSSDGVSWTEATSAAPWLERHDHAAVVLNGEMWVIGGQLGIIADPFNLIFRDVWRSADGATWTRATAAASWGPRQEHTSVVFGGMMWLFGGRTVPARHNDVWSSSDGVVWTAVIPDRQAPWEIRQSHTSVVFDNRMWVLGGVSGVSGQRLNDVWYSGDGQAWTEARSATSGG